MRIFIIIITFSLVVPMMSGCTRFSNHQETEMIPIEASREEINSTESEVGCEEDTDCACGTHKETDLCFVGNLDFVDQTKTCPDFCTGIGGGTKVACAENTCQFIQNTK